MGWTQPICQPCWDKRNPGRRAHHLVGLDVSTCCYCGQETRSGIYIRVDPKTVPYPESDDPPEYGPDDAEAQRIAEDFDQAATDYAIIEREAARELPWLGDPDRRNDDDVEFCIEGEDV